MINNTLSEKLFIAGTDTGVGKSIVSAILMAGLKATYWKPIQSGLLDETDTEVVQRLSGLHSEHFIHEAFRLKNPLSPHASAAIDGVSIQLSSFTMPECAGPLIVEGAGGIMVPLNDQDFMIDLIKKFALPVILVARSGLGTINHTLLSLQALRTVDIDVAGVVLNGEKNESNRKAIEHYGEIKVLAEVEPLPSLNSQTVKQAFVDWFQPSF